MVSPPSTIFRRARKSHQATVIDVIDEAEPVQLSNRNTMLLDGPRRTTLATASSLSRRRRSPSPTASRVGIEGASVPAPTPPATGTSITAHNANILRTMFNHSSDNTFNNTTFTSPARDSFSYSFHGPVTLTVHPNLIDQILRTQPTGLRGLDSTPSVPISGLQGSVSLRPWVDADALERGDGLEAVNRNSRLGRFINRDVQDTNDLIGPSNSFFFCD